MLIFKKSHFSYATYDWTKKSEAGPGEFYYKAGQSRWRNRLSHKNNYKVGYKCINPDDIAPITDFDLKEINCIIYQLEKNYIIKYTDPESADYILMFNKGEIVFTFNKQNDVLFDQIISTLKFIEKDETVGTCPATVKDTDNNIYKTVKIGDQCWMKENLKVTKNPAGEAITRYCYNDDNNICNTDGGLYDWNTAMNGSIEEGSQGICPDGWHIPKDSEWYTLENYLKDVEQYNGLRNLDRYIRYRYNENVCQIPRNNTRRNGKPN